MDWKGVPERNWKLMLRIGRAAFAKKLRQAREPMAGTPLRFISIPSLENICKCLSCEEILGELFLY
jgi:hypothetical protein